ncbi:MAG: glycosyl hydrolase [Niabella sp.]
MKKLIGIACLLMLAGAATQAQVEWPGITQTNRPWTRWWWEGSAVDEAGLTWNLEQYKKAGLGGVEITPIYGIHGSEKKFVDFLSPRWMQLFLFTLNESKRLGLGVDLANGTGWPFGGPWVTDADASKTIYNKIYTVKAGEQLKEPVVYNQEGLVRTANNKKASISDIKNPLSLNKNLQELALDQVQFPGKLPLASLIAYDKNGKALDVTAKVDANGKLNWKAPQGQGDWTLYALFEGLHGKMVERAAPGGEGYALDHFSKAAAENYFKHFDEAFKDYDISHLRAFFNDSYEVDDARGQANWTPLFFEEFKRRKGYDLRNELPALFGKDNTEKNSRVIYDYRSVIDELLLEHFTMEWKKWGDGKGKKLRNQSHGSPANTLDLYSVVDIPETEGTDILRFKFATSAANITGKPLVSSESATWLNEHFLSSWGDVKKALDLYFLGGVNHIFYHGTAYSPKDAKWPGWLFYAAVHFQPVNPQWQHFHALNEYVARVQSFLQNGKPDNDILLYYPIIDRYSQPGNALLQHFDGMEKNFENTDFKHLSDEMIEKGYSFDFFSDRQLQQFTFLDGKIESGSNQYKAILLPANKLITDDSFSKIMELVNTGATLLAYKELPKDVPGLYKLDARRQHLQTLLARLKFSEGKAVVGKGAVYISDDMDVLMHAAKARQEKPGDQPVYLLRRKTAGGHTYFVNNRTENKIEEWIKLADNAASAALFDAMSGDKGIAKTRRAKEGGVEVLIQLAPYASLIVQTYDAPKTGAAFPYQIPAGAAVAIQGKWQLDFMEGGPVLPKSTVVDQLGPWTDLNGEAVKNFSGIAKYSISFSKPGNARAYLLDLGKVNETAEVILNGKSIATLTGPSFTATIPAPAFRQNNKLEIIVANLMANRIAYMDRNNIPWKIFYNTNMPARKPENSKDGLFDASGWKPLPSGLTGPVTLTPLK